MTFSSIDFDHLAKLLGMLGSEHDGERAAAALKADNLIRQCGTTWGELLAPLKASACASGPTAVESLLPHRRSAMECLSLDIWSERERDFLVNISRKRKTPTPAQEVWLLDLLDRARTWRAAA